MPSGHPIVSTCKNGSVSVRQCASATVCQCASATVRQCASATVRQCDTAIVRQCDSATVQQCDVAQQCLISRFLAQELRRRLAWNAVKSARSAIPPRTCLMVSSPISDAKTLTLLLQYASTCTQFGSSTALVARALRFIRPPDSNLTVLKFAHRCRCRNFLP